MRDPADPRRLLDGTPVPVWAVSRVGRPDGTRAGWPWHASGAQSGRCAARAWWGYGFKRVRPATVDRLPDPAVLLPAAADERDAAAALLTPGLVLSGERNFRRLASPPWTLPGAASWPRRPAAEQDPAARAFVRYIRHRSETLMGLLKGAHGLEEHGARSWWGRRTRLAGVLAAYTIGRYLVATTCC